MGCSNSYNFDHEFLTQKSEKIVSAILTLDKFLNKLKEDLSNEHINYNSEPKDYYLINKFWLTDFKDIFKYEEIIKVISSFKIDINNNKISKENQIKRISAEEKTLEIIKQIILYEKRIDILINYNRVKNNFFSLNKGKAIIPDINTYLIEPEIFEQMMNLIKDFTNNKKEIKNNLEKEEIIIGNKQIYMHLINNKINLLICFLENSNLRTKFFITFDKEQSFKDIITNYLINNKLENYIRNKNYNNNEIKEEELRINSKKIGTILNLIKNEADYKNKNDYSLNLINNKYEININCMKDEKNISENNNIIDNSMEYDNINNFLEKDNINNDIQNIKNKIMESSDNSFLLLDKNSNNSNENNKNINLKNNFKIEEKEKINKINDINNSLISNDNNKTNFISYKSNQYMPFNNNNIINNNIPNIINNDDLFNNISGLKINRIKKMNNNNFINEFLQSLGNIDIIKKFFIENEKKIKNENKNFSPFVDRFTNILKLIYKIDNNPNIKLFDEEFLNNHNIPYDNNISFIECLFKKFKEELSGLRNLNIEELFYGERRLYYDCDICKYNMNNKEEFCFFEFNLYRIFHYYKKVNENLKAIKPRDCFNYINNNPNGLVCENCKYDNLKNFSYKYINIPKIIIIILENGDNDLIKKSYFKSNILLERESDDAGYLLISEIDKINNGNDYISLLKSEDNDKWYISQGNNFVEYEKDKFDKSIPYILIYKKVEDLPIEKFIDELDRTIEERDKLDLIFYSTVSKIKEKLENLEYEMKIEDVIKELKRQYNLNNRNILLFNNSRRLDVHKKIKDYDLENNDIIVIVEYNFPKNN